MPSVELPREPSATSDLRVVEEPGVAVVLVCTTQDAPTITRHAAALFDVAVEVLAGVERDGDLLRGRLLRAAAPTLFVLCKTTSLDADVMRRAVEAFGARRALGHRLLVIEFAGERASSWLASIRRTRGAMARAVARPESRAAGVPGMTDCGVDELVRGETRSRRTTRVHEPTADAPRVVLAPEASTIEVDDTRPIPPHQRTRSTRPHLVVVASDEESRASISDAELPQAVPVIPAVERLVPDVSAEVTRTEGAAPPRAGGRLAAAAVLVVALACLGVAAALSPADAAAVSSTTAASLPPVHDVATPVRDAATSVSAVAPPASAVLPPSPGPFAAAPRPAQAPARVAAAELQAPEPSRDAVDWHRAANRCHARRDDGGRPMRLPNLDEAEQLQRTATLGVSLWTRSRSNEPNANWIVGASGKRRSADKDRGAAHVLCVRDARSG